MIRIISIVFVLAFCFSCNKNKSSFYSIKEFNEYLNDQENGFIKSKDLGELMFKYKFIPALESDSLLQFTIQLRIDRKDGGSVLEYGEITKEEVLFREGYLSFDLINDVYIEFDGKTISPSLHHYERNYGLKPSIDMLFNFPQIHPKEDAYLVYRDQCFGQGLIKVKINKELFNECYVEKS